MFHSFFRRSIVSLQKFSYIKIPVSLKHLAHFKIFCLSLNLVTLQNTVREQFWFLEEFIYSDIWWHLSNSIVLVMPKFTSISSFTRASHSPYVSFGFSSIPSIRKLFFLDRSPNFISFEETYFGSRRSCWTSLMFLSKSLRSFFILFFSFIY